jgi:hypothetical protein
MRVLRQPPRIKVLEALSAVADGRVERLGPGMYLVRSSDGSRTYRVYVDPSRGLAYSDDNGTHYRGYIGYPIIAVLMLEGVLRYEPRLGEALRGIPWRRLNETLRRYALVEQEVKKLARERGVDPAGLDRYVEETMKKLRGLRLRLLPQPPLELAARSREQGPEG